MSEAYSSTRSRSPCACFKDAGLSAGDELLVGATAHAETIVRPLQQGTDATVDQFLDSAGIAVIPTAARSLAAPPRSEPSIRPCDSRTRCAALPPSATATLTVPRRVAR